MASSSTRQPFYRTLRTRSNLTREGLYRNIEVACAIHLDFREGEDLRVFQRYDALMQEMLDASHPNIQPISPHLLNVLARNGLIQRESGTTEPGPAIIRRRTAQGTGREEIEKLFPRLHVPVPPPGSIPSAATPSGVRELLGTNQAHLATTFIMQLSPFDSSHRTGVVGTPEVLIPHHAVPFFPSLSRTGREYPDVYVDVVLNTPTGQEVRKYRLWYYEKRKTGTPINEYRLRVGHETIDLSTIGGGDLLVISKLPEDSQPAFEVTVLSRSDRMYSVFQSLCKFDSQGKKWGLT